jgi:hypothetical protein
MMDAIPLDDRLDLRHAATDRALVLNVPVRRLFAIDGFGPPVTPDYLVALHALRAADQAVRALLRVRGWREQLTTAAECLWRPGPTIGPGDIVDSFETRREWRWTQLAEIPAPAADLDVVAAIDAARESAGREQPLIRVIELWEGEVVQILSVGGPRAEVEALRRVLEAVTADGLSWDPIVHQIFFTDPVRSPRDRWRSILRVRIGRETGRRGH